MSNVSVRIDGKAKTSPAARIRVSRFFSLAQESCGRVPRTVLRAFGRSQASWRFGAESDFGAGRRLSYYCVRRAEFMLERRRENHTIANRAAPSQRAPEGSGVATVSAGVTVTKSE
jgi:hypothetical protein